MEKDEMFYDVKRSKFKTVLLIIAIIIVLAGAGLFVSGLLLLNKPKMIFAESFNYLNGPINELKLSDYKMINLQGKDKLKVDEHINVNFDNSLELGFSNLDLDVQVMEDMTNKLSKMYLNSSVDSKKLVEFISYLKDNKMYFTFSEIFDKYYYMDLDYSSIYNSNSEKNINSLVTIVKDGIEKVIVDDRFEKEKTTTSVDGIKEDVTRISLKVDDILLGELFTEIFTGIKNDEELVLFLADVSSSSKNDVIKFLDESLEDFKDTTGETLFTYNIYYRHINEVRKLEILDGTTVVTYTANDGNYRFKVAEDGFEQFTCVITENDYNYLFTIKLSNFNIDGTLSKTNNSYNIDFKLNASGKDLGRIVIDYKFINSVQDNMVITYKNNDTNLVKITIDSKISFDENIVLPDLSSSKSVEDITEQESAKIMENLQKHEIIGPFISLFMSSGMENNYELDL